MTKLSRPSSSKLAGLDTIRGIAALGVVLLHACVPYLENPMPGLAWPVHDGSSQFLDCLFWAIEVVIMPVFLVLAGCLAWRTLTRRGPSHLVRGRANRLLIPLMFGCLVILPADLYIWMMAWVGEGLVEPVKLKSLKVEGQLGQNLWGLSHLWFLLYLFTYVSVLAIGKHLSERNTLRWMTRLRSKTTIALLVFCGIGTLWAAPEVVWGFQHSFIPVTSKWIYSATFFFAGAWLAHRDEDLSGLAGRCTKLALPAVCLMIASVGIGRVYLSDAAPLSFTSGTLMLAIVTTLAAWSTTFAIVGRFARSTKSSPAIQFLAASSFWVYLVHHPILGLTHTDLKLMFPTWSPELKCFIAFSVAIGLSLTSYEYLVRRTRFGDWLGFSQRRSSQSDDKVSAKDQRSSETRRLPTLPERRAA